MSTIRKSVQGGYCDLPDMAGCALTKLQCDDPSNFQSSRQMRDAPTRGHGGECRWQDSIKTKKLGMCFENDSTTPIDCAPTVMACNGWDLTEGLVDIAPHGFVDRMPECTVDSTRFGMCGDGMCAWSSEQCEEDTAAWTPFHNECTCDEVQVGACSRDVVAENGKKGREVFCAVSEDACDAEQSWIVPQQVEAMAGFECFLCREESESGSGNNGGNADGVGVLYPPAESSNNPADNRNNDNDQGSTGGGNMTTIYVVVGVGAVLGLLIVGVVGARVLARKFAAQRAAAAKEEELPPMDNIEIPSEAGSECETGANKNGTDTDNASVLSDVSHGEEP